MAPGEAGGADALTSLTVVVAWNWTISRNVVTGAGKGAESGSNLEIDALTTIVVGVAARWNIDTGLGSRTPRLTSGANTNTSLTIVVCGCGAISGDIVASIGN